MVRKAGIADPRGLGVCREVPRQRQSALALPAHAEGERTHAADREPGLVRRHISAVEDRAVAHGAPEVLRAADDATHHVAVTVDVLGERVTDYRLIQCSRPKKLWGCDGCFDRERRAVSARHPPTRPY